MTQKKSQIGWIMPALAISLIAGGGFGWYFASTSNSAIESAQATPSNAVTAPSQGQQVVAMLQALPTNKDAQEVSRTTSVDLLETAPKPQAEPVVVAKANVAPETADTAASASFFAAAQANLAAESSCGDDLRALAQGTKVYFPTGGLSPGDNGLASARLIGQVARDCPGFTVQVEGHSDPSGNPNANQILSQRRADVVVSRLAAGGIDTSRFVSVGYGDRRPSRTVGPLETSYYDRRVEFSIIENVQQASLTRSVPSWQQPAASDCVQALEAKVAQTRIFYAPRAITVSPAEMEAVKALAAETAKCEGARLRLVGQHSDAPGAREDASTGRLRVLAMMSTLVSAGFEGEKILLGSPSSSKGVKGQPGLPNSRVDFQIIQD